MLHQQGPLVNVSVFCPAPLSLPPVYKNIIHTRQHPTEHLTIGKRAHVGKGGKKVSFILITASILQHPSPMTASYRTQDHQSNDFYRQKKKQKQLCFTINP